MSEADSLRMVAEVVDRFSAPLRNLRNQLQSLRPGDGLKAVETAAGGAEKAVVSAGKGITNVLTPALATIGIGGLTAAGALTAVGAALRGFSGDTAQLSRLGREIGMTADQLRAFQALGGKFGISSDTMTGAARAFAETMRDFRRGIGENFGWLQSQGPAGIELAYKLMRTTNNDEAAKLVEDFMTRLPNGVDRRRFAERIFGTGELGAVGSEGLAKLRQYREQVEEELAKLPPAAEKNAIALEQAFDKVATTLRSIRDAIGSDLAPQITAAANAIGAFFQENRATIVRDLGAAITAVGDALKKIEWSEIGKGFTDFLKGIEEKAGAAVKVVREIAGLLSAIERSDWRAAIGALRQLDGANGPLARKLAPQEGDDVIDRSEQADKLKTQIDALKEQRALQEDVRAERIERGDKPGTAQIDAALAASAAKLRELEAERQSLLDQNARAKPPGSDATARKMSLDAAGDDLRSLIHKASATSGDEDDQRQDRQASARERLLSELRALSEELRKLRELLQLFTTDAGLGVAGLGATGGVGGALRGLVQRASLPGGGLGVGGGGYGGAIGTANDNLYRVSPRAGGAMEGTGQRLRSLFGGGRGGETANPTQTASAVDTALSLEGANSRQASQALRSMMTVGQWCADFVNGSLKSAGIKGSGSAIANSFLRWGQAASPEEVRKGDVLVQSRGRGVDVPGGHVGLATGKRQVGRDGQLQLEMIAGNTGGAVRRYWQSARSLNVRRALEDVASQAENDNGALRKAWPQPWRTQEGRRDQPDWSTGVGKDFDAFRGSSMMLNKARDAGVTGGGPTVNAPVHVNVEKPGPDTRIRTEAPSELFREVRLNRSRSMTMASQIA